MGIAEDRQLERELGAAVRTKPTVQIVDNGPAHWPVGAVVGDPNDTVETVTHPTPVRDKLRAAVADPNTSEQDRAAAKEALRIAFREVNKS